MKKPLVLSLLKVELTYLLFNFFDIFRIQLTPGLFCLTVDSIVFLSKLTTNFQINFPFGYVFCHDEVSVVWSQAWNQSDLVVLVDNQLASLQHRDSSYGAFFKKRRYYCVNYMISVKVKESSERVEWDIYRTKSICIKSALARQLTFDYVLPDFSVDRLKFYNVLYSHQFTKSVFYFYIEQLIVTRGDVKNAVWLLLYSYCCWILTLKAQTLWLIQQILFVVWFIEFWFWYFAMYTHKVHVFVGKVSLRFVHNWIWNFHYGRSK